MKRHKLIQLAALFGVLLVSVSAQAFSTWGGAGKNDSVDWGNLGAAYTAVTGNPFAINSGGGLHLTVGMPTGQFERADEGQGWTGNFKVGDKLLWTAYSDGPVQLEFQSPIFAVGAQLQRDVYGDFSAVLEAFDSAKHSLGSVSFNGLSSDAQDGSAIFAGFLSDSANIASISLNVTGDVEPKFKGFALGSLSLKVDTGNQVPDSCEYGMLTLVFLVAGSFVQRLRARRTV